VKPFYSVEFFQWGFYWEVNPECTSLEAASPDADENFNFTDCHIPVD